ncbi:helix-turn-helix transcriptional regulator [Corallococcus exiguus]|uniref:helix-turn-helix transcriptional regulator n=1 Tax=Corallococcus exiguus TaxID=83462 RepID=UPI001494E86E|nr:helix-turn-helix transcriptional regulator [Corallococcus exiguus]NPD27393.1 helix-turn-helix transcriptional regulator [Corallococcus exiguus]
MAERAFYELLGRKIASLRRERRLSQEELGRTLAPPLTRASVANIEAGRQRLLTHVAVGIAFALSMPVGDLLDIKGGGFSEADHDDSLADELAEALGVKAEEARSLARKLS